MHNGAFAPLGGVPAEGRVTNVFDESGRVTSQRFGSGGKAKIAYNDTDTTITDANGPQRIYKTADRQITELTVVTRGVRAAAKEATGTRYTTSCTYSAKSQRTKTVSPGGNATERIYDSANMTPSSRATERIDRPSCNTLCRITWT